MREEGLIFDWDAANLGHIAKHDVTPEEAEQVILGNPLIWKCKSQRESTTKNGFCNWVRLQRDEFCNCLQRGAAEK